jgi:hypothetical protein
MMAEARQLVYKDYQDVLSGKKTEVDELKKIRSQLQSIAAPVKPVALHKAKVQTSQINESITTQSGNPLDAIQEKLKSLMGTI